MGKYSKRETESIVSRLRWEDAFLWRSLFLFLLIFVFIHNLGHHRPNQFDHANNSTESLGKNVEKLSTHPVDLVEKAEMGYDSALRQKGGRAQQRPDITTDKIKAYVVSMNSSSPRYIRTKATLEKCGFYVIHVVPIDYRDPLIQMFGWPNKVFSNKFTMKMIWDWITSDPTLDSMEIPLSLIFEDDIELNQDFKHDQVYSIVMQIAKLTKKAAYSGFFYLGYGLGKKWPVCDESGMHEKVVNGVHYNNCNGRLFHATGLLKYEGKWLYDRLEKLRDFPKSDTDYAYMDAFVQMAFSKTEWCATPWAAGWNTQDKRAPGETFHKGVFFQDRNTFGSEI
eukprot:TRINITY_DN4650_c0_g1_i4.p1 TRINITY_DN4650_c0_g1~~TRINITY_DN4650_c0_g1_i4.p1  ORF type:complete len:338 (+),score=74.67 TRINITY_DN4650_c0_g1_i4:128-1141(+)